MLIGGNQHLTSHMKAQKCGGECQHPKPPGEGECPGHGSDGVQIGGQDSRVEEGVHKKWLFMNYIAADCNLKEFQAANIDNQELVGSDKNTHVVAMIDVGDMSKTEEAGEGRDGGEAGKPAEKPSIINWTGAKTYYVTKDDQMGKLNSPVVGDHGQVNMTDPKTLTNFIVDSMKKFPSDHVALVMNDHGGGFTGAMSDDGMGHGSFTMPQIKEAIAEAEKVTGKKIDILGFDACLMADVQAAHEFKDVANFLLASEETEGGPGWTYDNMMDGSLEGKPKEISNQMFKAVSMLQDAMEKKITVSPEEFCKIVVKVNEAHNNDIPTFSATDLTKMDGVAKAVDEFSQAILGTSDEGKAAVQNAIMNAEAYGGWMKPEPYCDMHDLHHLATLVEGGVGDEKLKKAAQGVQKAIGEAVIANETDQSQFPNSKGLSIFAPLGQKDGLGYGYDNLSFNKATHWQDAMKEIGKIPVPEQQSAEGDVPAELEQLIGQLGQLFGVEGGPAAQNNTETPKFWPDGTAR